MSYLNFVCPSLLKHYFHNIIYAKGSVTCVINVSIQFLSVHSYITYINMILSSVHIYFAHKLHFPVFSY